MKKLLSLVLLCTLLAGCTTAPGSNPTASSDDPTVPSVDLAHPDLVGTSTGEIPYTSRFSSETRITLSDEGITVDGNTDAVFTSHDIIYYEDRDTYDSGNPYGEGEAADKHTAAEADAHTVVNITAPGTYWVTGTLSAGQLRIDLGEDAYSDPDAVVELILDNASITCTVAPAILFQNVYECDGSWSADTATSDVDTTAAGANLILAGDNTVYGSYVARIYKDKEGEKKLWKQDGAIYSYMSLNVFGPGTLDLTAENEGLDTELHLTINGGDITIRSGNDGINTNEDGVSVTTINAGSLHIIAGLGAEGDGIDSNGYLVINGGTVVSAANPAADAGLDSDLGSYINGGTVIALGSTMDWAESDSQQATMNLQFAQYQSGDSAIVVTYPDGDVAFAYDPAQDEALGTDIRRYQGAVISCPNFHVGQTYEVYLGSTVTGTETGGVYDCTTVTAFSGGQQMYYTGTDVGMGGPGGFGNMGGGQRPDGDPGDFGGQRPEGDFTRPEGESMPGEPPEGFDGEAPSMPEGEIPSMPDGEIPSMPEGGFPGQGEPGASDKSTPANTLFYLTDKVNAFSGIAPVE